MAERIVRWLCFVDHAGEHLESCERQDGIRRNGRDYWHDHGALRDGPCPACEPDEYDRLTTTATNHSQLSPSDDRKEPS